MDKFYEILLQAILSGAFAYLFLYLTQRHQRKNLIFQEENKFKLAAIDKRLQVAQEAFNLWEEMRKVVHSDFTEKIKIVNECKEW